ncbi:hypothetical protein [Photorhabdus cinerea]|uniref:hypothetical protein n=1 Tax=Photorhabdus cinerea TaxID=471575 RepID=UPI00140A50EB|nr:hypothetical protein [Photorhabdus cinerea]
MTYENSRSLKGSACNAVHLRTFVSRYPRTPNPPFEDESFPVVFITGYPYNRAELALSHTDRYCFNRYNIHLHFAFITINVPKTARRPTSRARRA